MLSVYVCELFKTEKTFKDRYYFLDTNTCVRIIISKIVLTIADKISE